MTKRIISVWEDLEREGKNLKISAERVYRALGTSAVGIRAGYLPHFDMLELLIEVPYGWSDASVIPDWRGMGHEVIDLSIPPRKDAHHLRLFLIIPEYKDIFLAVCEDLLSVLEGITDEKTRVFEIEKCLLRWRRFFERSGPEGLSIDMQQGLFAELNWLKRLLEVGINPIKAVTAWKGCERNYHDFDFEGHMVEVKSTRTKEPRKITISNERQLDYKEIMSLHLYVLSVQEVGGGGMTLPEMVESVRNMLTTTKAALADFQYKLVSAGYLEINADHYTRCFVLKAEDFYHVKEGFPRITIIPTGVGDLRYSVQLASCESFRIDISSYLSEFMEI